MCSLSILKFVSSNRIDRLEVRIVFHEGSEIYVKSQGMFVSTVILSIVFFVLRVTALSLFRFLWLFFICYNSYLIIHLLSHLISNSYCKILCIYAFHMSLTDSLRRQEN